VAWGQLNGALQSAGPVGNDGDPGKFRHTPNASTTARNSQSQTGRIPGTAAARRPRRTATQAAIPVAMGSEVTNSGLKRQAINQCPFRSWCSALSEPQAGHNSPVTR